MENEARLGAELLVCMGIPKFEDADGDGEASPTDACPGTPEGVAVDAAGCSLRQFCRAIDGRGRGAAVCNNSDWKNDEALGNPLDCKVRGGVCVPR